MIGCHGVIAPGLCSRRVYNQVNLVNTLKQKQKGAGEEGKVGYPGGFGNGEK